MARKMRVAIGPPGGVGREWSAIDAEAKIRITTSSKPNAAEIRLWNLAPTSIDFLTRSTGFVAEVRAGDGVAGLVYRGDIVRQSAVTKRTRHERELTIKCATSRRVWRDATVTRSWPPGSTLDTVVREVLALATVRVARIDPLPPKTFRRGYAFSGLWRDALAELLLPVGYQWPILNGAIHILAPATVPGNVPLITPATGLTGSVKRGKKSYSLEALFNPQIYAPGGAQLVSSEWSGLLRLSSVEHHIGTPGRPWKTTAKGVAAPG